MQGNLELFNIVKKICILQITLYILHKIWYTGSVIIRSEAKGLPVSAEGVCRKYEYDYNDWKTVWKWWS